MKQYNVSAVFKTSISEILSMQKFSTVFPYMNLVNREGFTYDEQELNQIVQFIGEMPYTQVAEFFKALPSMVTEVSATEPTTKTATKKEATTAKVTEAETVTKD